MLENVLSNQIIISKKAYNNGGIEKIIETYIEDEYLVESFLLCLVSVASFYPIINLLNKQAQAKVGRRYFDQIMIYSIMATTFAHFLSEQKTF
mmetsp:Transcript_5032/g.7562  ORF Transcript_5032/g.7562 Transcript_5032/m.7562 type:complete len:93 (-) Transcript_5032:215-493(-)